MMTYRQVVLWEDCLRQLRVISLVGAAAPLEHERARDLRPRATHLISIYLLDGVPHGCLC